MTDKQDNKRSMYIAVQSVCNSNNSTWSGLPAFVSTFGDFETTVANIDSQRQVQEGKTTGITENKQKEEDEMIQITLEIASAVHAYASINDDNELRNKVSYSPSYLLNSRDNILKDICQLIHDEANKVIANLADYGKTADDLTQLQKEIDDYAAILAKPRTAIGTRATATTHLVELFKQCDDILKNRLDKLMVSYKNSEPVFYQTYQSARNIVDLGARRQAVPEAVSE